MKSRKKHSDLMILWKIAMGYVFTLIFLNNIDISDWSNEDGGVVTEYIFAAILLIVAVVSLVWPLYYYITNFRSKKTDKVISTMVYLMAVGYVAIFTQVLYVKLMPCYPYSSYSLWYCHIAYSDIGQELVYLPVLVSLFGATWMIARWLCRQTLKWVVEKTSKE